MSVVGLLLSRSAELLQSCDRYGKTGLHIAAMHGHYQMVEILLGQGAEINAADKNGWTPLHCAAKYTLSLHFHFYVYSNIITTIFICFKEPVIWMWFVCCVNQVHRQKMKRITVVHRYGLQHLKDITTYSNT